MVLITGATGFIGSALAKRLVIINGRDNVLATSRRKIDTTSQEVPFIQVDHELSGHALEENLRRTKTLVHLAGRVHVLKDRVPDPLSEYRRINVEVTANLAQKAANLGVERFVFLSSIKVNGEGTELGSPFTADDVPVPVDAYGISKLEAEQALWQVSAQTGMEVVIIRPPLVYGPGVRANFEVMMRLLTREVPLPLGAVTNNRRSLVALDNLVDFIVRCVKHPAAANQVFLVSDGEDLSTAALLQRTGMALGHRAHLLYIPLTILRTGAVLLRKREIYQRLCGSLQLDITKARERLSWKPSTSVDEGLRQAAAGFYK